MRKAFDRLSDWACDSLITRLKQASQSKRREVFQRLAAAYCFHCGAGREKGRVCECLAK